MEPISLQDVCKTRCLWEESLPIYMLPNNIKTPLCSKRSAFENMGEDERLRCGDPMIFEAEVQRRLAVCASPGELVSTRLALLEGMAAYAVTLNRLELFVRHVRSHNVCSALSFMARALPPGEDEDERSAAVEARVAMMEHVRISNLICNSDHRKCFKVLFKELEECGSIELVSAAGRLCNCISSVGFVCELSLTWKKHGETAADALMFAYHPHTWGENVLLEAVISGRCDVVRKLTIAWVAPLMNEGTLLRKAAERSMELLLPVEHMVRRLGHWGAYSTGHSLAGALHNPDEECLNYLLDAGCLPSTYVNQSCCELMSPYACVHGRLWFLKLMHVSMKLPVLTHMIGEALRYDSIRCLDFYLEHNMGKKFLDDCASNCGYSNYAFMGLHSASSNLDVVARLLDMLVEEIPKHVGAQAFYDLMNVIRIAVLRATIWTVDKPVTKSNLLLYFNRKYEQCRTAALAAVEKGSLVHKNDLYKPCISVDAVHKFLELGIRWTKFYVDELLPDGTEISVPPHLCVNDVLLTRYLGSEMQVGLFLQDQVCGRVERSRRLRRAVQKWTHHSARPEQNKTTP